MAAKEPVPRPIVRLWFVVLLTIPCLMLAGAVLLVLFYLEPMLRDRVEQEARARGVVLAVDDVDIWFGSLGIDGARVSLEGVEGVTVAATRVDVLLAGLEPSRAVIDGLDVRITRPLPDVLLDLDRWLARHPATRPFPVAATAVSLTCAAGPQAAPWLTATGAKFSHSEAGASFSAERAMIANAEVRDVGAGFTHTDAAMTLSLGSDKPEAATVSVRVDRNASPPRATISLAPTPLSRLSGPLGIPLPMGNVPVSGRADLTLPPELKPGEVRGHVNVKLDGFTPPHPVELGGFDFGDATHVSTDLVIARDGSRVDLSEMEVRAGDLSLRGGGTIRREVDHALVELTLRGKLSCKTIARSAARARVGSVLGKVLGDAAHDVLEGSVAVNVQITADSRRPDAPEVRPRIGIGCGLRPMTLAELTELGVDSVSELAKGVGVPGDLVDRARERISALPSSLPSLPPLPTLPSALPRLPTIPFGRDSTDDAKKPGSKKLEGSPETAPRAPQESAPRKAKP